MKLSGKMCLMITLKDTKNQSFILSLEETCFKKPQGLGQIDPNPSPTRFRVNLDTSV